MKRLANPSGGFDATASAQIGEAWTRRRFLGTAGALVVSFALPVPAQGASAKRSGGGTPTDGPDAQLLDSWLAVRADGTVEAAVGKIEAGMGVSTAFMQIVADELDIAPGNVLLRMGDTATTVDQRGTGSSNGIVDGGSALRLAAAEARAFLVARAAERLAVPAGELETVDGTVRVAAAPERSLSYGELLGGRRFEIALSGKATPKNAAHYRYVGKSVPRVDIPGKVTGAYGFLVDHKVEGMVHGRVIRPPGANAHFLGFEGTTTFPGLVRIVQDGDFVAVVCEREEQAVVAARALRVRWSEPVAMFSTDYGDLYRSLRETKPKISQETGEAGAAAGALATASRSFEAVYEYPFQSHACMGPGCGIADVRPEAVTVWMGGQKPYPLRRAVATLLGREIAQVRVVWLPGPGSYGMNDADDAAIDAVLLSRAVGRPVRVQYSRADGTAWDPKGPPVTVRMRGALDAAGEVRAFWYEAYGYSGRVRASSTQEPGDALSVRLAGTHSGKSTDRFQLSEESYAFPNKLKRSHLIPWEHTLATGLRTAHLRDPDGMATCFASESFVDELAAAAGADPIDFRLRYLRDERDRAVLRAVAGRTGWSSRPVGGSSGRSRGEGPFKGRGVAYAPRNGTVVAIVAEVTVHPLSGVLRVDRFVVAHDCGFVINPGALIGTIEANLIQGLSRTLHEAVRFTSTAVLSADWATYPILDMTEVPDAIDVVMLNNRPGAKSTGAGEPATRPVAAAVANAFFDATGVRLRRVPFGPEAVKAALAAG